jgi:MFS family permease
VEPDCSMSDLPSLQHPLNRQVWTQAIGRLFYQAGYGSIQFYMPLIFVNQVGLSATTVGIGMGVGSLAGIIGHLLGGYLADSPQYGRKSALLFSGGLSIMAAVILAVTQTFSLLVVANLFMGLSAGCYWTAADVTVIDITPAEQRHKAFAVMVLADSLGGGLGILGGGILLSFFDSAQLLFLVGGLVLLVFLLLIQVAVTETRQDRSQYADPVQGFVTALGDRSLQLFMGVNVLFTTYIALVNSTLPLYFTRVASETPSPVNIANLFTWCYLGLGAVLQLPLVQLLSSVSGIRVLMLSMGLWGVGFLGVWATGIVPPLQMIGMMLALGILSLATTIYKPFAPAIVAELAPTSLRGAYLALSYQCWSVGYFIGPILGGWAMDQSSPIAHNFWLVVSLTTLCSFFILNRLGQRPILPDTALVQERAEPS